MYERMGRHFEEILAVDYSFLTCTRYPVGRL